MQTKLLLQLWAMSGDLADCTACILSQAQDVMQIIEQYAVQKRHGYMEQQLMSVFDCKCCILQTMS